MNSASVDLIYLDPPFNSNANYAAPIGSQAAGAAFKDTWGLDDINLAWHGEIKYDNPGLYALLAATREINGDSMMSYLIYMAIRMMEMKRLLKPTGSIYLHCDPTASHYLKLLMDAVFKEENFRNEIIWCYRKWSRKSDQFPRTHDVLLFYTQCQENTFNVQYIPISEGTEKRWKGKKQGSIFIDGVRHQVATNEPAQTPCPDWWEISIINPNAKERVGYPTQKPLALLDRIIRASSNEGDMVLDPFCGCATACIAAEKAEREWVGIDISPKAAELIEDRMIREAGYFFKGAHRTDIPDRTDLGTIISYNDIRNKRYLYGEQGGYCNGCEHHFEMRNFTVDHIIAKANGGTDHISNLQLLCGSCNSIKGTRSHEELLVLLTDKGWIKRRKAA
ncbi:MAG: DNA methyltransferase [Caldilineaceae bacterium]|nr:DNA methyltransferase [Caldilineaceae bacterium]